MLSTRNPAKSLAMPERDYSIRIVAPETAFCWSWFLPDVPSFAKNKLTRPPNRCLTCKEPMVDVGSTQIIYKCINWDCPSFVPQYLHPETNKGGFCPYNAELQGISPADWDKWAG